MNISLLKKIFQERRGYELPSLLYRSDEELAYLKQFLAREKVQKSAPQVHKVHVDTSNLSLKDLVGKCVKCTDVHERKAGFGSGKNSVMIILNAPSMMSFSEIKLFKNESVDLMKKMISASGLIPEECYITNMIKCETRNMLNSRSDMFLKCSDILKREISEMNPKFIIVMGDMMPLLKLKKGFTSISWHNVPHPITLIKSPEKKTAAWDIIKNFIKEYSA